MGFANYSEDIKKFLSRKVHFYSLFTFIYYLVKSDTKIDNNLYNKYNSFVNYYNNIDEIEEIEDEKYHSKIQTYKQLSQEGTQSKKSRIMRFEILKELIT